VSPLITRQPPSSVFVPYGTSARLFVDAIGPSLAYQWYRGAAGDVSQPVSAATAAIFNTPPVTADITYWVRVSNANGIIDSTVASLVPSASFDSTLKVPHCSWATNLCDSGALLIGRGFGVEPNAPNAAYQQCGTDGASSTAINRIDRIRVSSVSGGEFVSGNQVRVEVDTVTSLLPGQLELSFAGAPGSPPIRITLLQAPFAGPYTFATTYQLPPGAVQTLHARLYQLPTTFVGICGPFDAFMDTDEIVFDALDTPSPPQILEQPRASSPDAANIAMFVVGAVGSAPVSYQWFRGTPGDTSSPAGTQPVLRAGTGAYWVRVSNPYGSVSSNAVVSTFGPAASAQWDPVTQVPRCSTPAASCHSQFLLLGRGPVTPESHQPNTIFATCQDGSTGPATSEAIQILDVGTTDGTVMAPGKRVRVSIVAASASMVFDSIDVYHAADAMHPSWTYITTLRTFTQGSVTLDTEYTLPFGPLQAIRARIRYQGTAAPCGSEGSNSYDDVDDLVFATDSPSSLAPLITSQPSTQLIAQGQPATLSVAAVGVGLTYQWYRGPSGDTSVPVAGATDAAVVTVPPTGATQYWVRVNGTNGSVDSSAATVTTFVSATAAYEPTLRVPVCLPWAAACDSGALATGRASLGPEPNAPNTLATSPCQDGVSGRFHVDESIDRVTVSTLSGAPFTAGAIVKVRITAWIFSHLSDVVDVYFSSSASNPSWTFVATLNPSAPGLQVMSTGYALPTGELQAVRVRLRYKGSAASCGSGTFDDYDDLVFAVGGPGSISTSWAPQPRMAFAPASTTTSVAPLLWPGLSAATIPMGTTLTGPRATTNTGATSPADASLSGQTVIRSASDPFVAEYTQGVATPVPIDTPIHSVDATHTSPTAATVPAASENTRAAVSKPAFGERREFRLSYAPVADRGVTYAEVWFSDGSQGHDDHACVAYIDRRHGAVYLVNDEGDALLSSSIGTAAELANSQCAIDLRSIQQASQPDALVVTMAVRLTADLERRLSVLTQIVDDAGISSGWSEQREGSPGH
jgi:hypothetical protein